MEQAYQCSVCRDYFESDGELHTHYNLSHSDQNPNNEVGITNIPPEILNIICKNLSWRDIKSLEEVLPTDIYQNSGVKREVIGRIIPLINDYRHHIYLNKKENKKEARFLMRSYYYQLRLYPYINFYRLHPLLDSHYERIVMCNNLVQGDNAMIVKLRKIYHEIFLWSNK